jgi:putative transposase
LIGTAALKTALWRRDHADRGVSDGLIHHSDASSQYASISFAEPLCWKGLRHQSVASVTLTTTLWQRRRSGCSLTEAIGRGSPFLSGPLRTLDDVEYATMEWVDWFNNRRLHSLLDYVPPEEYETAYYAQLRASQPAMSQA